MLHLIVGMFLRIIIIKNSKKVLELTLAIMITQMEEWVKQEKKKGDGEEEEQKEQEDQEIKKKRGKNATRGRRKKNKSMTAEKKIIQKDNKTL